MSHPDLKAEQVVLLQILNAYIHAEKDDTLPPDFLSFEPLFALSHAQGVAPVVWHALSSDQRALRDCPAALAALWRADSDRESAAQAQREAQFLDLYQLLRESGLHPLVLKGAVCRSLYAWPTLRASCDEDILLQKDEFEEFDILIRACGFFRDEKQSHAVSYTEPESALHVDVSFEPFRSYHAFNRKQNAAFRDVFDRAEELDISGTKVLTPEPTKNLLFLILHHLKHFCSGGAGLRMLCDIVAFTERFSGRIDRDRLCRTLRDFGLERYVGALEAIGRRYLGLPPEDAILPGSADGARDVRDLLDDMFAAGSHGTLSHTRVQSARITLAALDDGAGRGSVWKNLLFPARGRMLAKYSWAEDRPLLLPAAYAARIAGVMFSVARGRLHGSGKDADAEWIALGKRRVDLLQKYGILDAVSDGAAETDDTGSNSF